MNNKTINMRQRIAAEEDILAEKIAKEDMLEEYGVLYDDDFNIIAGRIQEE